MRHTGWCRIRVSPTSDPAAAAALIPQGRALLGQMMQGLQLVGQPTGVLRRELTDGSTIAVSFDGTTPVIAIDVPAVDEGSQEADLFALWIPRGFVTRPAWIDYRMGVGLPVVEVEDPAANLDPGTDPARWTYGGICGQLLLTKDADAGYPDTKREVVPLLYSRAGGPLVSNAKAASLASREWVGEWKAYRMSWSTPVALYRDESIALSANLITTAILARVDEGVIPPQAVPGSSSGPPISLAACFMWPRGWYRPAQISAYLMQANTTTQATSTAYPPTYRTVADRLSKDGYSTGYGLRLPPTGWTGGRADSYGAAELRGHGSADDLVQGWLDDADTRAQLLGSYGYIPFIDAGNRAGFASVVIAERDAWIQGGNGVWHGDSSRQLPPVSWRSFFSMKLYWETWPVAFNSSTRQFDAAVFDTTAASHPAMANAAVGAATMQYILGGNNFLGIVVPVLDRSVYMYGRCIAMAPGLVWAAGVMQVGDAQRLIALVHHNDDQPTSWHDGLCRYLRVWWVDLPANGLAGRADRVVCGTDATDPYGWKGGELIDVGVIPTAPTPDLATAPGVVNSLKYDSVWRFSADGTKATCLRDYFSYDQMLAMARERYDGSMESVAWGGFPLPVELFFSVDGAGDLTTTTHWHDWPNAGNRAVTALPLVTPYMGAPGTETVLREYSVTPMAADYDANGQLVVAYNSAFTYLPFGAVEEITLQYMGTGAAGAEWADELSHLTLLASSMAIPEIDFDWNSVPQVVDVVDAVFVTDGVRPKYKIPAGYAGTGRVSNPTYRARKQWTSDLVHGVHLTRMGQTQALEWYPCNDGIVFQHYDLCDTHLMKLPPLASENVHACYVRYRGDWLLSYQLAPQIFGIPYVLSGVVPSGGACGDRQTDRNALSGARGMNASDYWPRGGRQFASFDLPAHAGEWAIEATCV